MMWPALLLATVVGRSECTCDWLTVDARSLTSNRFRKQYLEKEAVILTDLIDNWPAVLERRWTLEALIQIFGDHMFDSSHVSGNSRKGLSSIDGISLREFLTASEYNKSSWFVEPHAPIVRHMLQRGDFFVPNVLGSIHKEGPFLSLARKGQWNPFHSHEGNWFAQVEGSKRWFALAPSATREVRFDLGNSDLDLCNDARLRTLSGCTLRKGQVLYLPSNYVHGTCALEDPSVALAFIGSPRFLKDSRGLGSCLEAKFGGVPKMDVAKQRPALKFELLFLAAAADNVRLVRHLADHGVDLRTIDSGGRTPIAVATEAGALDVVKYLASKVGLREMVRGQSLLHAAAVKGHVPLCRYLVRKGLDPRARDDSHMRSGLPAVAAYSGHLPVLRYLRSLDIDLRQPNAQGLAPWHFASLESFFYVVDYLHGLFGFDFGEFLEWAQRAEAPASLIKFLEKRTATQRRQPREL